MPTLKEIMNDDLIGSFVKTAPDEINVDAKTTTTNNIKNDPLIRQFLKTDSENQENLVPAGAPINGKVEYITKEEKSKRENAVKSGGRDFPNPASLVADRALEGVKEMGQGVSDMLTNKSATGVGKIGTGALNTAFSIPAGVGDFATELTGNPTFGGAISLGVGGAAPVKAVSKGLTKLPKTKAFRELVEDIGPENAGYVAKEMRNNPNLTPADLSPRVRMGVQKLHANVEGPHANYIEDVAKARLKNAASDLENHMNANLGAVIDPVKKLEELKQNVRDVGAQHINPAIAGSKPVDLSHTIAEIDKILKPGVNSIISHDAIIADPALEQQLVGLRKLLTDDKSIRTDPEQLNRIQSAFRKKAEILERKDPYLSAAIYKVRENIVDAIDKASGGKYKPALEKYRDEFHIHDAYLYGHDTILKNGKALSDRPEYFEKWVKSADDKELQAAKEGARIAYDTQMNAFKSAARRGTDIGEVEFNKRRMTALFGEEEAAKMFKVFEDAKKVADTNNKLVVGSQSRIQRAQNSKFEPYDPDKSGGNSAVSAAIYGGLPIAAEVGTQFMYGTPVLGGLVAGAGLGLGKAAIAGGSAMKTKAIKALEAERNMSYSKMALPIDPVSRNALIQQLEAVARQPSKQSLAHRTATRLMKVANP